MISVIFPDLDPKHYTAQFGKLRVVSTQDDDEKQKTNQCKNAVKRFHSIKLIGF
jgi:hypothetical protein